MGLNLSTEELARWIEELRRAAGPALTANQTMGSLGGLVASRIAREFRIGGPSFTVSCDELSGIQAMAIAVDWLRRGELDTAIVGAVDLAGDVRAVLARDQSLHEQGGLGDPRPCPSDGAVSLVLKRLDDAQREGGRIYAVLPDQCSTSGDGLGSEFGRRQAMTSLGLLEIQRSSPSSRLGGEGARSNDPVPSDLKGRCFNETGRGHFALGSVEEKIGEAGAASGLASAAKAALCLYHQILPATRSGTQWHQELAMYLPGAFLPAVPQFWLRNQAEGPRRAGVKLSSQGGQSAFLVLEEPPGPIDPAAAVPPDRSQPMGERRLGLFALAADDQGGPDEHITDLDAMLAAASSAAKAASNDAPGRIVRVAMRGGPFQVPAIPSPRRLPVTSSFSDVQHERRDTANAAEPVDRSSWLPNEGPRVEACSVSRQLFEAERATSEAHDAYLRMAHNTIDLIGLHIAFQLRLIEQWKEGTARSTPADDRGQWPVDSAPVLLDRSRCQEFASGSIAAVFGSEYTEVDRLPIRVRLPDGPLMLVDRVLSIEGRLRSLEMGRVVTEHEIQAEAWYLDAGRIAPCIAMEAGQADLLLCGYLGVDFETRGMAVYRLLDATVTFHRRLPGPGTVIRYDIAITSFFRQGKTILFRFQFDATVEGQPLLTMRDGCAGFFTPEELASGKGIVLGAPKVCSESGSRSAQEPELVPIFPTPLDRHQVDALRMGDFSTAFGPSFQGLPLDDPITLPGGLMTLVHRVASLDPDGGPLGLGYIRAQAEIQPDEWFMACHFIDDPVMPGTLMYESCLHALRILMMRLGWLGRRGQAAYEPVPGLANRLQCRGQITESTRLVFYEVTIKQRGYRPEPYAVGDALIIADGKPIVAVTNLALQLSGSSRQDMERLWQGRSSGVGSVFDSA
jgi:3-hydroxymyristoyl/3-hydroxydecanoyl-(acyl carrier protein) dehydratase